MLLRYENIHGRAVPIETREELLHALRTGRIHRATPVQLGDESPWVAAGDLPEFEAWAEEALSEAATREAAPSQPRAAELTEGQATWYWLGVGMILGGLLVMGLSMGIALAPLEVGDWILLGASVMGTLIFSLLVALGLTLLLVLILRRGRRFWLLVPILGLLLFGQGLYGAAQTATSRDALVAAAQPLNAMLASLLGGESLEASLAQMPMLQWVESHVGRLEALGLEMQESADRHELATLLSPESLSGPTSLQRALENARAHAEALTGFEARYRQIFAESERGLATVVPAPFREREVARFREGTARQRALMSEFFQVEHRVMAEIT
ncbi:MAG: hypothetical protein ACOY93_08040, partial [Bacillota bacterium]